MTCAVHAVLPTSMRLELLGDIMDNKQCRGGYGVVSMREYRGREVAVKTLLSRRGYCEQEMSKVSHHLWTYTLVRSTNTLHVL